MSWVNPIYVGTEEEVFCHELCSRASDVLQGCGFVKFNSALTSEATYWAYPGRKGLLRLAAHAGETRKHHRSDMPVVARLTFSPQTKFRSFEVAENQIAASIGWFFIRSTAE